MANTQQLQNLLRELLVKRGDFRREWLPKVFSDDAMKIWHMAFTHSSADPENNYEQLEFVGDTLVNLIIANYVAKRFPHKSVQFLTVVKHSLISENTLPTLARELNFEEYITIDPNAENVSMYKVLEDVYEAFFGALIKVCDLNGWVSGVAFEIAKHIVEGQLETMHIGTTADEVLDPVSWVKEMYEKYGWPTDKKNTFQNRVDEDGVLTVTIWGYPKGDKKPIPQNRVKIYTHTGQYREPHAEVRRQAFRKAREILDKKWGISYAPKGM